MAECSPALKETLKTIVTNEDLDELQQRQALADAIQQSNESCILEELRKLNQYMSIMLDIEL